MSLEDLLAFARANAEILRTRSQPSLAALPESRPVPAWLASDNVTPERLRTADRLTIESLSVPPRPGVLVPEVLGFYLPFHAYDEKSWGIYLRGDGIVWLAEAIKGSPLALGDEKFLERARIAIHEHEYFHCVAESAATRVEVASLDPIYLPYSFNGVSIKQEEAMANAAALRLLMEDGDETVVNGFAAVMKTQGPGYEDFDQWVTDDEWSLAEVELSEDLRSHVRPGALRPVPGTGAFLSARVSRRGIPTYMVRSTAVGLLRPFPKFAGMKLEVHTNDHLPPHFHVQQPIGRDRGSFVWALHTPVRSVPLSPAERANVSSYLQRYGEAIRAKLAIVYGENAIQALERAARA